MKLKEDIIKSINLGIGIKRRLPFVKTDKIKANSQGFFLFQFAYKSSSININGIPKGIRTPVAGMKTRCPRPLDDGDIVNNGVYNTELFQYVKRKSKKSIFFDNF